MHCTELKYKLHPCSCYIYAIFIVVFRLRFVKRKMTITIAANHRTSITHVRTHINACACAHTHTHTGLHSVEHVCVCTHALLIHTCFTYICMHACTDAHTCAPCVPADMCACLHVHVDARTNIHTHFGELHTSYKHKKRLKKERYLL